MYKSVIEEMQQDYTELQESSNDLVKRHQDLLTLADLGTQGIRTRILASVRRMQELEVKAHLMGYNVDPSVTIEIANIRTEVEKMRKALRDIKPLTDFLIQRIINT